MGKKAAAKKGGKEIVFCTTSVKSKKEVEREAEAQKAAEEAAAAQEEEAAAPTVTAASERPSSRAEEEEDLEDWERLDLPDSPVTPVRPSTPAEPEVVEEELQEEDWDQLVDARLKDELQKLERKVNAAEVLANANLERRGGYPPAGVVVLNKVAEQKVEAALAPLRDGEGFLKPILPRHWRFKGKLTWERLSSIYTTLEALNFKGDQIRLAMGKTGGYDARAPLEWLLVNLPKQELPRYFGGDSVGDLPNTEEEGSTLSDLVEAPFGPAQLQMDVVEEAEEAKAGVDDKLDVDKELPQPVAKQDGKRPACDKEVGKEFARRYMEQYEEEDEEDALLSPEEILERERKKDPTARYIKVSLQFEESSKILKALKEKRRHGAFKQNISADQNKQRENTNKFQSCKAEMELLESGKYGPLDQERIAKAKPRKAPKEEEREKPAKEEKEKEEKEEAKETEEDSMLPSLFDEAEGLESVESHSAERPKARRSYSLAGWTGRKPKEALEDFGRNKWGKKKDGLPYAKYSKLSGAGGFRVRVTVQLPKNERRRFDPEELCESKEEAEHLAATLALMKLSQDSEKPGLQRGLPPVYRQRWQEWDQELLADLQDDACNAPESATSWQIHSRF
ncbi:ATP-dependent RNA helicase DHX29 (DEAH box protein 29) [Durusdinium trenchii]|uniref:ATP-dependent RNA helicase DHX29 (DEAH box protein 29) n=1 Tax=Durusdinium trenchii TaxID=1381693 RepID=A0ABP0J3X9_9DINO